jgi:hypothetical protein
MLNLCKSIKRAFMRHKLASIIIIVIFCVAISVAVVCLIHIQSKSSQQNQRPKIKQTTQNINNQKQEPTSTTDKSSSPAVKPNQTPVTRPSTVNTPQSTDTPKNNLYGADPADPKRSIVYDKNAVMNLAGIPNEMRGAADYVISHESGWAYIVQGSPNLVLCLNTSPGIHANLGAKANDPVEQLKACDSYMQGHYSQDSWNKAQELFQTNGYL